MQSQYREELHSGLIPSNMDYNTWKLICSFDKMDQNYTKKCGDTNGNYHRYIMREKFELLKKNDIIREDLPLEEWTQQETIMSNYKKKYVIDKSKCKPFDEWLKDEKTSEECRCCKRNKTHLRNKYKICSKCTWDYFKHG